MNKESLAQLSEFLQDGGVFASSSTLPEAYLDEFDQTPSCDECGAAMEKTTFGGREMMICQGSERHERPVMPEDSAKYRLDTEVIFNEICDTIDVEPTAVTESPLPGYVLAETNLDLRVALVCDTTYYDSTLDDLFSDSVKNQRINVVFTPMELEGDTWDRAVNYPLGSLAPPFPLKMLAKPEPVLDIIQSAMYTQQRSNDALSMQGMDGDLFELLNQNPRLIQSELAFTRMFRETSYSRRVGDRLEKVTKAALMTMDMPLLPTFGGRLGENETDIASRISEPSRLRGKPILALLDTKSNSEAKIGEEGIAKKHANYLRQANAPTFDNYHIAHVFVVYAMEGLTANEIQWYDAIQREMEDEDGYSGDTTMVVLFAGALTQMVDAHLSLAQRNQINLSVEDLGDSFQPFFNYRLFKEHVPLEVREMTRKDDAIPNEDEEDGPPKDVAEYISEYRSREQLLVVTPEMVHRHLQLIMSDSDRDFVEHQLDSYPSKWY